jgi:hypothetical protein
MNSHLIIRIPKEHALSTSIETKVLPSHLSFSRFSVQQSSTWPAKERRGRSTHRFIKKTYPTKTMNNAANKHPTTISRESLLSTTTNDTIITLSSRSKLAIQIIPNSNQAALISSNCTRNPSVSSQNMNQLFFPRKYGSKKAGRFRSTVVTNFLCQYRL